jgi:hypothetical protein
MGDVTHTEIEYDQSSVVIGFSSTGFIISVMQKVGPEKRSGVTSPSWPQHIPDSIKFPILTGTFEGAHAADRLIDIAASLAKENSMEIDWYRLIVGQDYPLTGVEERAYRGRCVARIAVVDGISDTIARVHYCIKGVHTLYYDTWWFLTNSEWKQVTAVEAKEVLTAASMREQK